MLNGAGAYNPARKVKAPPKPRAIPRALDYATIYTTLNQMDPTATKAFLLVMASCGFRPVEIKRTEPSMIHHEDQDPYVIRNIAKRRRCCCCSAIGCWCTGLAYVAGAEPVEC